MLLPLDALVRRHNIHLNGVLHVGAHTGEENDAYRAEGVPQSSIYWVEAIPEMATALAHRLPNVIQAVVSDVSEPVVFNVTNNIQSSSILELQEHRHEHPDVTVIARRSMISTTLDTIVETHGIRANFLNMDIQGAELKCLRGFEKHIAMIDVVYAEVNTKELYKGCALLHELDDWLSMHGFDRKQIEMTRHGWGDALYIRRTPHLHLHSHGRGGNQLFQIAAATVLAREQQCDLKVSFMLEPWSFGDILSYSVPYADSPVACDALNCHVFPDDARIKMRESLARTHRYAFSGWFESWPLLRDNLDIIKQLYTFKTAPVVTPEVVVHLRLGDVQKNLVSIPELPSRIVPLLTGSDLPIVILSDSLSHPYTHQCRAVLQSAYPTRSVTIASPASESHDFMRMVQCQHLVGTTSTFVFWSGLLGWLANPEKKTTVCISNRMFAPERTRFLYRSDPPGFCTVVDID